MRRRPRPGIARPGQQVRPGGARFVDPLLVLDHRVGVVHGDLLVGARGEVQLQGAAVEVPDPGDLPTGCGHRGLRGAGHRVARLAAQPCVGDGQHPIGPGLPGRVEVDMHEPGVDGLAQQVSFIRLAGARLPRHGVDPEVVDQRVPAQGIPGQLDRGEGRVGGEAGDGVGGRTHGVLLAGRDQAGIRRESPAGVVNRAESSLGAVSSASTHSTM